MVDEAVREFDIVEDEHPVGGLAHGSVTGLGVR
jgi:hypothetical protein